MQYPTAPIASLPAKPALQSPKRKPAHKLLPHLILILMSMACLVPTLMVVSASFTDEVALTKNGYSLIPSQFSLAAYRYILTAPKQLVSAYGVSLFITIAGTILALLMMSLFAYTLSRPNYVFRRLFSMGLYFTMLFGGGIVSYYIVVSNVLHLKNTLAVLILPMLVAPYYVFMLRSYFSALPAELFDAARVDGADEFRIFFEIVVPLSKPALATIAFFLVLAYWNDYMTALYFITDTNLYPLQYMLYIINTNANSIAQNPFLVGQKVPVQPVRMAMAVLATGPAALAFLSVQKYLVKGITMGAFK